MDEEKKEADLIDEEKIKKYLDMIYEIAEADTVEEQKALLQKMYGGTLTPEELEAFFPKD